MTAKTIITPEKLKAANQKWIELKKKSQPGEYLQFMADELNKPDEPQLSDLQKRLVAEGWTAHHGGGRPVPDDTLVDIHFDDRPANCNPSPAKMWEWVTNSIIAYRLAQPEWNLLSHVEKHFGPLPEGARFHRGDFTKDMLPDGWRPLLKGEKIEDGKGHDEYQLAQAGDTFSWQAHAKAPIETYCGFWRTRRPLPVAPRVVPWDFESAPLSVKVRRKQDGIELIATLAKSEHGGGVFVIPGSDNQTYEDMLTDFEQLDGTPCGTEGGK